MFEQLAATAETLDPVLLLQVLIMSLLSAIPAIWIAGFLLRLLVRYSAVPFLLVFAATLLAGIVALLTGLGVDRECGPFGVTFLMVAAAAAGAPVFVLLAEWLNLSATKLGIATAVCAGVLLTTPSPDVTPDPLERCLFPTTAVVPVFWVGTLAVWRRYLAGRDRVQSS
ncbi:MAG TPA: hypothetical protein DDY29_12905 [Rhodobacteraceae bacterium]|jgi:hypothetical protein|nr:hypothetical protein [Paracoccaceae bacterium]HBG99569.1 hypothetical protein [Paracoccaceae bacterium]